MVIGILYSEAGCGKSAGASTFQEDEPLIHLDLENRCADYEYNKQNIPKGIKKHKIYKNCEKAVILIPIKRFDNEFNEDKISSFDNFVNEISKLIKLPESERPLTVVIDGIGDLRDYAHEKWCKLNNRKHAKTPGDYAKVNDLIRDTLFPLINWTRIFNLNLIMTSQLKDDYIKAKIDGEDISVKCGRIPLHKEFCSYNVDFLIELWQPKKDNKIIPGKYIATCLKSEIGSWEEDISGKNLYYVFKEKGMI